jgi:hypothetical protein
MRCVGSGYRFSLKMVWRLDGLDAQCEPLAWSRSTLFLDQIATFRLTYSINKKSISYGRLR